MFRSLLIITLMVSGCLGCASAGLEPVAPPPRPPPLEPIHAYALPDGVRAILPLPAGESIRLGPGAAMTLTTRGGTSRERIEDTALTGDCTLLPWGPRAFAACGAADPRALPVQIPTIPESIPTRLFWVEARPETFLPGRDGRTLTVPGVCAPDPLATVTSEAVILACTASPGRPWRDWRIPGVRGTVLDVYDGYALVSVLGSDDGGPTDVRLYDIDAARWMPLELPDPAGVWIRAGFSREGRVVGLIRTGIRTSRQGWVVTGAPGHALDRVALDAVADDLGVIDRRRMVFTVGDRIVATDDGGATFRPVIATTPVQSPPAFRPPARAGMRVVCSDDVCVVDGRVTVPLPLPSSGDPVMGG